MGIRDTVMECYDAYWDYYQTILSAKELGLTPKEYVRHSLYENVERRNEVAFSRNFLSQTAGHFLAAGRMAFTNPLGYFTISNYLFENMKKNKRKK